MNTRASVERAVPIGATRANEFGPWRHELHVPRDVINTFARMCGDANPAYCGSFSDLNERFLSAGYLLSALPAMRGKTDTAYAALPLGRIIGTGPSRFRTVSNKRPVRLKMRERLEAVESRSDGIVFTFEHEVLDVDTGNIVFSGYVMWLHETS